MTGVQTCALPIFISTHVMWTTATAPPLPAPSTLSLPISNTPSHPVVLTSLNPRNKITKTVQVPAFTDNNRNRDFERDWDKDRYGARSSLSPHLATLGKKIVTLTCLPSACLPACLPASPAAHYMQLMNRFLLYRSVLSLSNLSSPSLVSCGLLNSWVNLPFPILLPLLCFREVVFALKEE